MTLSELPGNPFEDNVVFEPRDAEQSVHGLNDGPLQSLLGQFARLEAEPLPRRQTVRLKAQLVTSAEPGYGKSHLIGRLFGALQPRATLVYLPPFQDAGSSWRSILLRIAQELNRPRKWRAGAGGAGPLTQLDALACGVISHLLLALIDRGKIGGEGTSELTAELRADPLGAFGHLVDDHYLTTWMRERFASELRVPLTEELQRSGIVLHTPAGAWLKVLHAYAFGDRESRSAACLEWLKGEGTSDEERELIGLERNELPPVEESAATRNRNACARVEDLLALAGFYQPFLLCFDQTDLYADVPERAAEFGGVIEELVRTGLNQMTVVTANVEPWTRVVVKHFQTAYLDRFTEPLQLTGITRSQAEALARQRLRGCGLSEEDTGRFVDPGWLDEAFRDVPTKSTRTFLRQCARRCAELVPRRGAVVPEKTLADHYSHYEAEVSARADWCDFAPDILRWSVGEEAVGDALPGVSVGFFRDLKQYFPIAWKSGPQTLLLGFEDSSHAMRWRSILRAAQQAASHTHHEAGEQTRVIFLRTPTQRAIPGPGWKVIGQELRAARGLLAIEVMTAEALLSVCACYELYVNVVEGNAPFPREEMLGFVRAKLKPWWQTLLAEPCLEQAAQLPAPQPAAEPPDGTLAAQIRHIVATRLFLSLDQLLTLLGPSADAPAVLALCQTIPEIHVFATSQATILKWRSSPSASAN